MTATPLSSNDHGKLFVFALLILPPTVFGVGAIPFLFVVFGLVMLRKSGDAGHIETAARNFKIYCWLCLTGFAIAAAYWGMQPVENSWDISYRNTLITTLVTCAAVAGFYIVAMNVLFLHPLRQHRDWIEQNGIFASRSKAEAAVADTPAIDIIKGERLRSFSVADELLKWAKLKEDGHISEQEFNEARAKLLQKS